MLHLLMAIIKEAPYKNLTEKMEMMEAIAGELIDA